MKFDRVSTNGRFSGRAAVMPSRLARTISTPYRL